MKNLTMKELPDYERPNEKCLSLGPESLSDAELISVIIRTGCQGEKSLDLAQRILNAGPDGVLNLIYLDVEELQKIHGIGQVKAAQLKCVGELAKRISGRRRHQAPVLKCSAEIAAYFMEEMRHEHKEIFRIAMFDRKSMLIRERVITIGTSNMSLISPGEIFKEALKSHAEYLVLLHNHPSGNPEPSRADIEVTHTIRNCGELLGIPVMDHIIIGDHSYFSFYDQGILMRKEEEDG